MEDTNSASDWSNGAQESPLEAPLVVDTGDTEALISDQTLNDGAPRTPTYANRISISELIRTLTQPTAGLFPQGVAPKELFDFMCKLPEDQRVSKSRNHLQVLLWRDVKLGKICRVGVGVYTVPEFLEQISQYKGGQSSNNCASMKSQVTTENSSSTAVVSTTTTNVSSRSPPPSMSVNEQDSTAWQIINETVVKSAQFAKNNKRKKKKETKVDSFESTPQISPSSDSNEKTENGIVSSTTTVDGPENKPKRKRVKKQHGHGFVKESSDSAVCFFCQMTGSENIFGQPESFICCTDCNFKAHPSCLGYSVELAERCRSYPWQCFDCKLCSFCFTAENPEAMLMCDNCDRGYHMQCHSPIIEEKPPQNDKWICADCLNDSRKKNQNGGLKTYSKKAKCGVADSSKRQVQIKNTVDSIGTELEAEAVKLNAQIDKFTLPAIDDNPIIKKAATEAKLWSVDQVFSFIAQLGFPEQANAFKREEIDGQALLLLKRNDVLSMLSLKLGPALKIHRRLATLQSLIGEVNDEINEDQ